MGFKDREFNSSKRKEKLEYIPHGTSYRVVSDSNRGNIKEKNSYRSLILLIGIIAFLYWYLY